MTNRQHSPVVGHETDPASGAGLIDEAASPTPARGGTHARVGAFLGRYGLLIGLLIVVATFSIARPSTFPTWVNATAILAQAAPMAILALSLTVVLIMRDFDLSFASVIGASAGTVVVLMSHDAWAVIPAIAAALTVGLAVGAANGFLVAYLGGSSFIITLAMGTLVTGVEFAITSQETIIEGIPAGYLDIGQGELLGLSNLVWIAAALAVVLWVMLEMTEAGRYMYAVGDNPEASRLAGVRVRALRLAGFVIVGLCAAGVGVLLTSQSASYTPNPGPGYLLPAYAGVFLGTTSFRPGQFTIIGTVVGVLFLGVIQTGLTMLNLETWTINILQGAILLVAVLVSARQTSAAV